MPRKNPKERVEQARLWNLLNPEKVQYNNRTRTLKRRYGLTREAWEAMLEQCSFHCQICGVAMSDDKTAPLSVRAVPDHCHETGKIRGVLCHRCNKVLGMVGDNLQGVMRFVTYLRSGSMAAPKSEGCSSTSNRTGSSTTA